MEADFGSLTTYFGFGCPYRFLVGESLRLGWASRSVERFLESRRTVHVDGLRSTYPTADDLSEPSSNNARVIRRLID